MSQASLYYIVWKEGQYYVSQCLNVDVSSFGQSRQEAIDNLHEAVELYREDEQALPHAIIEEPEIISVSRDHA